MGLLLVFIACKLLFAQNNPVLLIGGSFGSQLNFKRDETSEWDRLWLTIIRTILDKSSYIEDLKVNYNPQTKEFYSTVFQVDVDHWNSTSSLDHADDLIPEESFYYRKVIQALNNAGYVDGVDLFGAPYDFRIETYQSVVAPGGLFSKIKTLIETICENSHKPVYIMTHSQSSSFLRYFFAQYVDSAWKSNLVAGWISAAGSFGGDPVALHHIISYKPFMVPTVSGEDTFQAIHNYASFYWSLPTLYAFPKDFLLAQVTTDTTAFNVTLENITVAIAKSVGDESAAAAYNFEEFLNSDFSPPNVDLYYYYGTGTDTVAYETYEGTDADWWKQDGTEYYIDGDGLLPTASATAPEQWKASPENTARVVGVELPGCTDVLNSEVFFKDLVTIVTGGGDGRRR